MATEKVITVNIGSDGQADIDPTKGFKDGSCLKETLALQEALGDVKKQTKKAEAAILPTVLKQTVGSK